VKADPSPHELAFYLLPGICLNQLRRGKSYPRTERTTQAYFSLFPMLIIYDQIEIAKGGMKEKGYESFFTLQQTVHGMNFMRVVLDALGNLPQEFSMAGTGTMDLESYNTRIRASSHQGHTYATFRNALRRLTLLDSKKKTNQSIRRRGFECGLVANGKLKLDTASFQEAAIFMDYTNPFGLKALKLTRPKEWSFQYPPCRSLHVSAVSDE